MNYRSDNPVTHWPETMAVTYRSEAFAEDLEPVPPTHAAWQPLKQLLAAVLPLLCVLAPVADAYLVH